MPIVPVKSGGTGFGHTSTFEFFSAPSVAVPLNEQIPLAVAEYTSPVFLLLAIFFTSLLNKELLSSVKRPITAPPSRLISQTPFLVATHFLSAPSTAMLDTFSPLNKYPSKFP